MRTAELKEFKARAHREQAAHDRVPRKAAFTPPGEIVKEARKMLHAQSEHLASGHEYINAKMRESMDSRAARQTKVRPVSGQTP